MNHHFHIPDPAGFRKRLIAARRRAGLSQREVAIPGCSAVYASRIETGQRAPSMQVIQGLADHYGVSAHWLLTGKDDPLVEVARKIVEEYREGAEVSEALIARLDRLTRPAWYGDYRRWLDQGAAKDLFPVSVPKPVPAWARRLYRYEREKKLVK